VPESDERAPPGCPKCSRLMRFAAAVPRLGNASGMHFFECEDCGTITRVPVPHSPPKK
jgi:RNase P subunit RPR2